MNDPPAPAPKKRPAYDVDSITDVALEVFRTRGYDGTSMEQLAEAAGVSKAAFYHHVGGKEDLLALGLTRSLNALFAMLDEPESSAGPAIDRLRHVLRRIVALEHDMLAEVTVLLRARGNTDAERDALVRRRTFDRRVARMIATAQAEGDLRADLDPQPVSRLVIGMATWIVEWYQPGGRISATTIADTVVAIALDGAATRPS